MSSRVQFLSGVSVGVRYVFRMVSRAVRVCFEAKRGCTDAMFGFLAGGQGSAWDTHHFTAIQTRYDLLSSDHHGKLISAITIT